MKTCPACRESFGDDNLNFCLNCGSMLAAEKSDAPPPTVFMDASRRTNPYFNEQGNFNQGMPPAPQNYQAPMMQNQPFGAVAAVRGTDQVLPTVSLVLGILGLLLFCCYGGLPLGIGALITGYLGMKNVDRDPQRYGGKGLAVGGLVLGGISLVGTIGWIIFVIIASAVN